MIPPIAASPGVAIELAAIAERLRRVTVSVRGSDGGDGAGVVWDVRGVIVTNAHVARTRRPTVVLADGRAVAATITRWDPERDLAVLAVDLNGLVAAEIGDSDALRPGALVLAVGHPLGIRDAVSAGVMFGAPRALSPAGRPWLRADLRLAPGNSGGPLADARGRVVGINAMIAGGLAVAVPSRVVEEFLAGDRRRRASSWAMR